MVKLLLDRQDVAAVGTIASQLAVNDEASKSLSIFDLDFPRLRSLHIVVQGNNSAACDAAIVRFVQQCCPLTRLTEIRLSTECGDTFGRDVLPMLFRNLAGRPSLRSPELHKLHVARNTVEPYGGSRALAAASAAAAAEVGTTATPASPRPSDASTPFFPSLQRLAASIAAGAVATLASYLPASLTTLHLTIYSSSANAGGIAGPFHFGGLPEAAAAAAAVAGVAACAPRLPNLRELVLLFEHFVHSAEELSKLARLSQLEVLWF
jgi:hypothetical protein